MESHRSLKLYLLEDESNSELTPTITHIKLARNEVDIIGKWGSKEDNKIFVTVESLVSEKMVND